MCYTTVYMKIRAGLEVGGAEVGYLCVNYEYVKIRDEQEAGEQK